MTATAEDVLRLMGQLLETIRLMGARPASDGAAEGTVSPPPSADSRVLYYLSGPTYAHREVLKSLGWRWNAADGHKRYERLLDDASSAQKVVEGLSKSLAVNRA